MARGKKEQTSIQVGRDEFITNDRYIDVEPSDIEEAVARDQYGCAMVRAIQRKFPDAIRVTANAKTVGFTIGESRYRYPTPQEAIEGIIRPLDTGGTPEPMSVRLRGGTVRPVKHQEQSEDAKAKSREGQRQRVQDAKRQGNPLYHRFHEYERF